MAQIGTFGDVVFQVSNKKVRTFDGLNWKISANYATHDRHLKRDLLEFCGPNLQEISFDMHLSVFFGLNPMSEINKLKKMCEKGIAKQLIIGKKKYGSNKWVIKSVDVKAEKYDNKGNLWTADVSISLTEYPKR